MNEANPIPPLLRNARRVLLVRLRSLGDAVLMTPLPLILQKALPGVQISVLVEEPLVDLFRENPSVHSVLTVRPSPSLPQRVGCIVAVREGRFDVVINLHSGPTAGIITALSGAPVRVAYGTARYSALCNVRVPPSKTFWGRESVHTVEHQVSPLLHLGVQVPETLELQVNPPAAAAKSGQDRMAGMGLQAGRFFLMHPFATLFTKEWDAGRFAELGVKLAERYGVPVVATAGPREEGKLAALVQASGGAVRGVSGLPLGELIAWIQACGLYIGNDSGPTHIAAALKKKMVVLWGSSDYRAWHPWSTSYQMLRADLACIPCPGYRCYEFDSPRCIESISVPHALAAVERLNPFA